MSFQTLTAVNKLAIELRKKKKGNAILTLLKCKVCYCLKCYISGCIISEYCKTKEDMEKDDRVLKRKQLLPYKEGLCTYRLSA